LKKKIAAAEAAKAAKRKAQTSSGAATPTPQHQATNGSSVVSNSNGDIASKVEASIQMQQLIGIAEDKVSSDQKRLAEAQASELEKAAELKRNEAESRRLRREKIATDLPRVDAEVEQKQLKLQQLREEMAKIEATIQKDLEDKRRLAEEMERLGQETEDQLQEQKDKLKDLTSENASASGM
jgi:chromosome segregation ATPase